MRKKYNTSLHTIRGGLYFKESAKFTSSRYTINYKHFGTLVYKHNVKDYHAVRIQQASNNLTIH